MTIATVALVSIGIHPASGRPRRAEQDARAVELGLQMAGDKLQVLHAGNIHEPSPVSAWLPVSTTWAPASRR